MEKIIIKIKLIFIPCEENKYRPKFLEGRFLFYLAIALLALKLIAVSILVYSPKTIFFADLTKTTLIKLINQERELLGVQPLNENPKLNEAAYLKAKDMIEKDYFAHQSPEGISPWYWFKEVGYNYKLAGENLAIGFLDSEEVSQAWLDSPSHKKNIINSGYKETGIAVVKGEFQGNETVVAVQLFGTPQVVLAAQEPEAAVGPQEEEGVSQKPVEEEVLPEEKKELAGEIVSEEALSQSEEFAPSIEGESKGTSAFNFFRFISFDYNNLIQKIIYGSLILIVISLIVNIFVRFDIQDRSLIFKTVCFIGLLIFFVLLDKGLIIQIIPHNFSIY